MKKSISKRSGRRMSAVYRRASIWFRDELQTERDPEVRHALRNAIRTCRRRIDRLETLAGLR